MHYSNQMELSENMSMKEILGQNEHASQVFQTYGINSDYKDSRTLYEICESRGIELSVVIECLILVNPDKQEVNR